MVRMVAALALATACSGKSASGGSAGGQASVGGNAIAGASQAGSPAAGGSASSGVGGLNIMGDAGEPGVAMGGTSPGGPCGGGAAPPTAGTGVIGGTWGRAGSEGMGEAGAPNTIYLDCSAYQRCGLGLPGCNCYSIRGCNTGICAHDLCEACPGDCFYLDSYPGQVQCDGASYVGIEPEADALIVCN